MQCQFCGALLIRHKYRCKASKLGFRWESEKSLLSRKFCNNSCKGKAQRIIYPLKVEKKIRNAELVQLYLSREYDGVELAKKFGITHQRVYQILKREVNRIRLVAKEISSRFDI